MKVIVFGGSGFIGSHVSDVLSERGHKVTIFDRVDSKYRTCGQKMIVGDILNTTDVEAAIRGQEVVYNFAGFADLDGASIKPRKVAELNIIGNLNILEACRKNTAGSRFIYASTVYVYSESGGFYRCSKQASELFIEEYRRKFGVNFTILRYGTVYGPRADERNSMHRYLKQAFTQGEITFAGTGEEFREYLHVRDAAILSADAMGDQYKDCRLIITGHQATKVKDMFKTIFEILKKPVRVSYLRASNNDHYAITPYSYVPKVGKKLSSNYYTDIGQGLIECLVDMTSDAVQLEQSREVLCR